MSKEEKNTITKRESTLEKIEKIHPHLMLLNLGILGIVLVFLFLISAFFFSLSGEFSPGIQNYPNFFYLSTLVIVSSSLIIQRVVPAFQQESLTKIRNILAITTALGIAFCIFQVIGWQELKASGIDFQGRVTGTYLYLISGLHMAHLIGGMVFLAVVFSQVTKKAKHPVEALIFITSPYERLKLRMLAIYWHFMDFLWILLFLGFLLAF